MIMFIVSEQAMGNCQFSSMHAVLLAQLDMPDDVTEDDGVIQACVVLNRQPDVDVTVTINTQDVTATGEI